MGTGKINGPVLDRVAGALVGLAVGDALGAPYEFTVPGPAAEVVMQAGGPWELGEWTDDTAQAVAIAQVAATGHLDTTAVAQRFLDWFRGGPKDVGISTGAVLRAAGSADGVADAAAAFFASHPRGAAGNGSLMRTAPVALAHLGDDDGIAAAARRLSLLTHGDPLAADACVLWCVGIDRAVRKRRRDGVRDGLALLAPDQAAFWAAKLDEAEGRNPHAYRDGNGFVVTALQAAWAVVTHTPVPGEQPARHFQRALQEAVRVGNDTDTVAAIAGQLLGGYWGLSAIPWRWRRHLHGWPGLREPDLVRLAVLSARHGTADPIGWPNAESLMAWGHAQEPEPVCVTLPDEDPDAGALLLGNLPGLEVALDRGADAVVSLCRTGRREVPPGVEHARFWLVDRAEPEANVNLEFALAESADAVATLRSEGKRVYLHCLGGRSRTAAVAATYLARRDGVTVDAALRTVEQALPDVRLNPRFEHLLR